MNIINFNPEKYSQFPEFNWLSGKFDTTSDGTFQYTVFPTGMTFYRGMSLDRKFYKSYSDTTNAYRNYASWFSTPDVTYGYALSSMMAADGITNDRFNDITAFRRKSLDVYGYTVAHDIHVINVLDTASMDKLFNIAYSSFSTINDQTQRNAKMNELTLAELSIKYKVPYSIISHVPLMSDNQFVGKVARGIVDRKTFVDRYGKDNVYSCRGTSIGHRTDDFCRVSLFAFDKALMNIIREFTNADGYYCCANPSLFDDTGIFNHELCIFVVRNNAGQEVLMNENFNAEYCTRMSVDGNDDRKRNKIFDIISKNCIKHHSKTDEIRFGGVQMKLNSNTTRQKLTNSPKMNFTNNRFATEDNSDELAMKVASQLMENKTVVTDSDAHKCGMDQQQQQIMDQKYSQLINSEEMTNFTAMLNNNN